MYRRQLEEQARLEAEARAEEEFRARVVEEARRRLLEEHAAALEQFFTAVNPDLVGQVQRPCALQLHPGPPFAELFCTCRIGGCARG